MQRSFIRRFIVTLLWGRASASRQSLHVRMFRPQDTPRCQLITDLISPTKGTPIAQAGHTRPLPTQFAPSFGRANTPDKGGITSLSTSLRDLCRAQRLFGNGPSSTRPGGSAGTKALCSVLCEMGAPCVCFVPVERYKKSRGGLYLFKLTPPHQGQVKSSQKIHCASISLTQEQVTIKSLLLPFLHEGNSKISPPNQV
jgi:hypothetical protein